MSSKKKNAAPEAEAQTEAQQAETQTNTQEGEQAPAAEGQEGNEEAESNEFADLTSRAMFDEIDEIDTKLKDLRARRLKLSKALNARLKRKG